MLTLRDLMERLKQQSELDLLETLDISSEDLVERFADKIEDRYESLNDELQDEEED
jgi:hypothetical protein